MAHLAEEQDRMLPKYVQNEFEEYLKCGILSHGFLRECCECCHHERHVAFSCKRRGFHMIFLDGFFVDDDGDKNVLSFVSRTSSDGSPAIITCSCGLMIMAAR